MLVGCRKVGKDTSAIILCSKLDCNSYAIADPIKDGVCEMLKVNRKWVEENKDEIIKLPNGFEVTVRSLLIGYGKMIKGFYGLDCFLDKLKDKIVGDPNKFTVISDGRLLREPEYFRQRFDCIVIKVLRDVDKTEDSNDLTEVEPMMIKADYEVDNNGTLEELHDQLEYILSKEIE